MGGGGRRPSISLKLAEGAGRTNRKRRADGEKSWGGEKKYSPRKGKGMWGGKKSGSGIVYDRRSEREGVPEGIKRTRHTKGKERESILPGLGGGGEKQQRGGGGKKRGQPIHKQGKARGNWRRKVCALISSGPGSKAGRGGSKGR